MTAREFQLAIRKFRNPELTKEQSLCNAALGIAGESGELVDLVKKEVFHGVPMDGVKLLGELGDVLHYVAWLADEYELTLEDVFNYNLAKLNIRYPDGFVKGGGNR